MSQVIPPHPRHASMHRPRAATVLAALALLGAAACQDTGREPTAGRSPPPVLVDINRASIAELKALPGVDDVRARRIVEGRPYRRKDELRARDIVPASVYEELRERVIARQP